MLPANQKEATSNRDKRLVFEELEEELRKVEKEKRKKEKKRLHSVSRSLRTLLIDFQFKIKFTIGVNIFPFQNAPSRLTGSRLSKLTPISNAVRYNLYCHVCFFAIDVVLFP